MPTHILMNVVDGNEMRVAIIRDGRLESVIHDRVSDDAQLLGNIYKAKVANVEPSLDAAFLDLGTGKNGFIHVDEVRHDQGGKARIEKVLKPGQEIVVQITKEAIKDKGPCVSTYLSLPGRSIVMMSGSDKGGVSRRIEDQSVRKRLRDLLKDFDAPDDFSFIARTAASDRSDDELKLDRDYLTRLWQEIDGRAKRVKAPACLYQEGDVVLRTLRDIAPADVDAVIIDQDDLYDEARAFAQVFMPEIAGRIQLHRDELPLFTYYGVEERLESMYDRTVRMPSGGTIVIEQTEALVSIDVNSARNKEGGDVAQTALMTNMEAVTTIAEQLILRDLGGLIIIDFIDMESRDHQRMIQLALRKVLLTDKAKTHVAPMSRFGLVEMTRQRTRPSHKLLSSQECTHCRGTGVVKSAETFEIDVMRMVRAAIGRQRLSRIELVMPQDMAVHLLNARRRDIDALESRHDVRVSVVADGLMKARECRMSVTPRKTKGKQRRQNEEPVRPALLAPMLEQRARALEEAKALLKKSPADLERELSGIPTETVEAPVAAKVSANEGAPVAAVLSAPARRAVAATQLRELLFTAPSQVLVGPVSTGLAANGNGAKSPRSSRGRSRRRRR